MRNLFKLAVLFAFVAGGGFLLTACAEPDPKDDPNDTWPDTTGYTHFDGVINISEVNSSLKTVSPGQKYYSSGAFGSYGNSRFCGIKSEQECAIKIDFSKFNLGSFKKRLNGYETDAHSGDVIQIIPGDILILIAQAGSLFTLSGRNWMFGFSVEEGDAEAEDDPKFWRPIPKVDLLYLYDIKSLAWGGDTFVFGYQMGRAYSGDAITWNKVESSESRSTESIAYGGGTFVAGMTSGCAAYSSDGITWTDVSSTLGGVFAVNAIAYGEDTFVAGCENGSAYYSSDGITWTIAQDTDGTDFSMGNRIYALAYGGDTFVAGGAGGKMVYSSDGITWTAVTASTFGTSAINAIAYGGDTFIAGGAAGKMAYSSDGITWTAITGAESSFGTSAINAIAHGGDLFVAVGADGKMAYSDDGITWSKVTFSAFEKTENIYAITYGGGKFIAGGKSGKMAYIRKK